MAAPAIIAARKATAIIELKKQVEIVAKRVGIPFNLPHMLATYSPDFKDAATLEALAAILEQANALIELNEKAKVNHGSRRQNVDQAQPASTRDVQ